MHSSKPMNVYQVHGLRLGIVCSLLLLLLAGFARNPSKAQAQSGPTILTNGVSVAADQTNATLSGNSAVNCVTVGASATLLSNSVNVVADQVDSNFADNVAANCLAIATPNLVIGKSGPATATQGTNFAYTLVVTNTGGVATSGVITVTDSLPAGLSFVSGSGITCAASGQNVTCTSSTAIAVNGTATINLTVNPTTTGAKSNTASVIGGGDTSAATSNSVNTTVNVASAAGIEYKLLYNSATNRYEVWLRPTHTPGAPNQTVTGQVTIKAPHVAGSGAFTPTNSLAYTNTLWTVGSVVRAPSEAAGYDYLSFDLDFPTGNTGAFAWQAGVERLAFSFQNGGVCSGTVMLMANNDAFNIYPNSAGTNPGNAIDVIALGNDPGNDFLGDYSSGAAVCPVASSVTLPVKLLLQGPYVQAGGMMTDTLRSKGLVPTNSPYTATATTTAGVLAVTGNNAIVDWVLVEVRNSVTPATVVARQSALLQRDGDVVAVDGTSTLTFTLAAGNYHVAVKHRNHLGAMTAAPVALSAATPLVNFTTSMGYGAYGQATMGSVYALWMGNTSGDNRVIGAGPTNDRNAILAEALAAPGNANHNANYIVTGYSNGDVNLDGRVIAAGPGNDINYILYNIFIHPGNSGAAANFVVQGQAP